MMAKSPCETCQGECNTPQYGCKYWKNWFLRTWNENICRFPLEQKTRQVFTYEHPDRVREMAQEVKDDA